MNGVGKYLIGIAAAAFICGICRQISEKLGTSGKLIQMLAGIFMAIAVLSPLRNISIPSIYEMSFQLKSEADAYVTQGEEIAYEQLSKIITEQVRTYILEKASELNARLEVSIDLTESQLPQPCAVHISGAISPYAKSVLSTIIADELGIPEESQTWTLVS